ncbi:UvrD-helicase domain-containing protein [bacterium]|nr:UvrD-helicase domain-containing protein [bacterium]
MENSLNEKQTEAVEADIGPVAVIAGAGTGKTHVLTNRFIYVVNELGLKAERILTMTFTNKAAEEMKSRITKKINQHDLEYICTFHSLCLKILRHDIDKLNRNTNFNVIDEEEQTALLKEIYKEKSLTSKDISYKKMLYVIEK